MLAAALGLSAGLAWGVADFLGGLASRRRALLTVLAASQGTGLALAALVVLARGEGPPGSTDLLLAGLSGITGAAGLAALYRGLAVGAMSVVAPIASTAAAVPVVAGLISGERPSALQAAGIVVAMAGVAIASRQEGVRAGPDRKVAAGAGLALLAALGFGSFFVLIDEAADADLPWAILANRIVGVSSLLVLVAALRPEPPGDLREVGGLMAIGFLDIAANTLFAAAAGEGLVSVVAVLASLYPVTTILLARLVLRERVGIGQRVGVVAALVGVALLSAG